MSAKRTRTGPNGDTFVGSMASPNVAVVTITHHDGTDSSCWLHAGVPGGYPFFSTEPPFTHGLAVTRCSDGPQVANLTELLDFAVERFGKVVESSERSGLPSGEAPSDAPLMTTASKTPKTTKTPAKAPAKATPFKKSAEPVAKASVKAVTKAPAEAAPVKAAPAPAKAVPVKAVTKAPAKAKRQPGVTAARTPEQQARFVAILTEARDMGAKWHWAAKTLTAEAIPTSKGGGWYFSTVQGLAKSMGLDKV